MKVKLFIIIKLQTEISNKIKKQLIDVIQKVAQRL